MVFQHFAAQMVVPASARDVLTAAILIFA